MSKRLASVIFVVLASCIFLVACYCLVLFLAPGFSAFGVKYIRSNVHLFHTGACKISDTKAFSSTGFSGNIIVETNEVPVNIIYTEGQEYYFDYYDNYQGFTTSKFDDPSFSITRDAAGNAVIKTTEFKKFIYESSSSERYLNIYIPLASVCGDFAYGTNLSITTNTGTVTFTKEQLDDKRVATHGNLTVNNTSSKVVYEANVHAVNFNQTTNNSIKMLVDQNKEVYATNYKLESKLGKISVLESVVGDISAKTESGDIQIVACKNFVAESNFGDISCVKKDEVIHVRGIVILKTQAGAVELGDVEGNGDTVIATGGGSVEINKIKDATITTTRGSVKIKSLSNAKIETNIGKVTVNEALESISVSTKRGNIVLGAEGLTVNNPTVFSRLGKVTLAAASGKVNIETVSSAVSFTNTSSQDITITSGGKLSASKLTGVITINAKADTSLDFAKITNQTKIVLADTCHNITIIANNNTEKDTKFYFSGRNVIRYEDEAKVKEGNIIQSEGTVVTDAYISVEGKNAAISAYFKKP